MRVRCLFHGRKINAIGIFSFQCVDLEVSEPIDFHALNMRMYDTHEHISQFRVIDRETGKEIKP